MDAFAFFMALVALALTFSNRGRINKLENALKRASQESEAVKQQPLAQGGKPATPLAVRGLRHETAGGPAVGSASLKRESAFVMWLKTNPLMKLGVAFVLLAFAWFVRFAYINEWIGEHTIIFGAFVLSAFVLVFGFYDSLKWNIKRGLSILGVGVSMSVLAIFAGRFLYEMYSAEATFAMLAVPLSFSALAAYYFDSKKLMAFVYALAALAPFLTLNDAGAFFALFGYLLLINLFVLTLSFLKNWHILSLEAFIATIIYSVISFVSFNIDSAETMFAYLVSAVFAVSAFIALARFAKEDDKEAVTTARSYLVLALLNTMLVAVWTFIGMPDDLHSPMLLLWAFVFLLMGFFSFAFYSGKKAFYVFSASSMLFLALVSMVELDLESWLAAFSIEALFALIAAYFISKNKEVTLQSAKLFAVPSLLSLFYFFGFIADGFDTTSPEAVSTYLFTLASAIAAYFLHSRFAPKEQIARSVKLFVGMVFAWVLAWIWFVPHDLIYGYNMATLWSIIIYALLGSLLYFNKGEWFGINTHKLGTYLLFALAIRVLLVDLWELDLAFRIVAFALLGVVLISTAYRMGHHRKTETGHQEEDLSRLK